MENLEDRFTFHEVTDEKKQDMEDLRNMVIKLAGAINIICPESREKSLSITHLEETLIWANKAIVRN
jgi:hypothetical protein